MSKQEMVDLAGKVLDGDADEHDKHSLAHMVLNWFKKPTCTCLETRCQYHVEGECAVNFKTCVFRVVIEQ